MNSILAVDTSASETSVALQTREGALIQRVSQHTSSHNEELADLVNQVLQEASCRAVELDALVVGSGPGSFTGLRIGFAFMKGLSLAARVPLTSISSLDAMGCFMPADSGVAAAVADARRNEFFTAFFKRTKSGEVARVGADAILDGEAILKELERTRPELESHGEQAAIICGDQLEAVFFSAANCRITRYSGLALKLLQLFEGQNRALKSFALDDLACLEPVYLRQVAARTIAERRASRTVRP